jgi:peptidoglycan/LPS O-acetylase OafA/YrhL
MTRIKELDGLRALAILAVLLFHFRPIHQPIFNFTEIGWAGVDLFFVISGFLITGILVKLRHHPTPFKEFYWRRVLRIFPPYYLALLFILLLAFFHAEEVSRMEQVGAWFFSTSLFKGVSAHLMAQRLFHPAGLDIVPQPFDHHHYMYFKRGLLVFWSLSVEEFFYLVWAPIVLKGSRRLVVFCSVAPLIVCPLIRALNLTSSNFVEVAGGFITRFDTLSAGACLSLLFLAVQRGELSMRLLERGVLIVMPASAAALALLSWRCGWFRQIELRSTSGFNIFGYGLLAIFFATLVAVCVRWSGSKVTRALRIESLMYLGSISYMMYLIHVPLYVAVGVALARIGAVAHLAIVQEVLAIGFTIALAALSWKYFESPILKFKDRKFGRSIRGLVAMRRKAPQLDYAVEASSARRKL